MLKVARENVLRDATHYMSREAKIDQPLAYGVVVGIVDALMSVTGCLFDEAMETLSHYAPDDYRPDTIPTPWIDDFNFWRSHQGRPIQKGSRATKCN